MLIYLNLSSLKHSMRKRSLWDFEPVRSTTKPESDMGKQRRINVTDTTGWEFPPGGAWLLKAFTPHLLHS